MEYIADNCDPTRAMKPDLVNKLSDPEKAMHWALTNLGAKYQSYEKLLPEPAAMTAKEAALVYESHVGRACVLSPGL